MNGRTPIDDCSGTWNDVASDAEDAIAYQQPIDEGQLATQTIVGALESAHVRRPDRGGMVSIEQAAKRAENGVEHASW